MSSLSQGLTQIKADIVRNASDIVSNTSELAALPVKNSFESLEQVIVSGGLITQAHGLGLTPKSIMIKLVCKVAEHGYTIGNELIPPNSMYVASAARGMAVFSNNLYIYVRFDSDAAVFGGTHKDTGVSVVLTNANWSLVIRAIA